MSKMSKQKKSIVTEWKKGIKKWKKWWRRSGRDDLSALAALAAGGLFLEMRRELRTFRVRRYTLKIPCETSTGEPVKVVFVSDLHGKKYGHNNVSLVRAIRREHPDVILSGGDILTRGEPETDLTAIRLYEKLSRIAPVYAANGNHEQRMREYPEYYGRRYERFKHRLSAAGVKILENESVELEWNGIPVCLTGLEIPLKCYSHFKFVPLDAGEIIERVGIADQERFQVLLAHNPAYMDRYAQWGSGLTLSGHLHGGLIRIPGIGGLITPQARLFPKYSGDLYMEDNKACVVSRGLGTHTVNVRLFNPAEVVSITLSPKKSCVLKKNQV